MCFCWYNSKFLKGMAIVNKFDQLNRNDDGIYSRERKKLLQTLINFDIKAKQTPQLQLQIKGKVHKKT